MLVTCNDELVENYDKSLSNSPIYSPQSSYCCTSSCTCNKSAINQAFKNSNKFQSTSNTTISLSSNELNSLSEYRSNRAGRNASITASKTLFNHHNNCYCCVKPSSHSADNDFILRRHSLNSSQINPTHSHEISKINESNATRNKIKSASNKYVLIKNYLKPVINVSFAKNKSDMDSGEELKSRFQFKQYTKVTLKSFLNKNVNTTHKTSTKLFKNRKS